MKRICTRCNRISIDGNLWCQEKNCPAENTPEIFENSEWIGNIEILKLVTVLRTSAIYIARRDNENVLLKVAHYGFEERLKRESQILLKIQKKGAHPALPVLLPAYKNASVDNYPYGKNAFNGKTLYYEVFKFVDGRILRDSLIYNAQPWYLEAGWITLTLADAIVLLKQNQILHFCLSPDIVLIRYDQQHYPHPILLDLGVASAPNELMQNWNQSLVHPAYIAPELITLKGKVGPPTEVYGLGLTLFEMLAGFPAYNFISKRDEDVYNAVLTVPPPPTGRIDLKNLPEIAEKAINKTYDYRQKDIIEFARQLQANIPVVPVEKKPFKINWRTVGIVMAALMAISLLVTLALIFNPA
jgi:serine/threonine protein kinase